MAVIGCIHQKSRYSRKLQGNFSVEHRVLNCLSEASQKCFSLYISHLGFRLFRTGTLLLHLLFIALSKLLVLHNKQLDFHRIEIEYLLLLWSICTLLIFF